MEKNLLFVYNPVSGKGKVKESLNSILSTYTANGYKVTVHPTSCKNDGKDYIAAHANEYDIVSVCGGDGMFNECLNGLMQTGEGSRPPIAYIPAGSTNDFAGTIGLPSKLSASAKVAMNGEPFKCDAGKLGKNYFAYVAAFGAFTSVAYSTKQDIKNIFGRLAYIMEAVHQLPSIKSHHITVKYDGNVIEDDFILGMVTNTFQVGGIKQAIKTAISLNDGLFEVLLIKKPTNPLALQAMLGDFFVKSINTDEIIRFKASKIEFVCDENLSWTIDGEYGGDYKNAVVENINNAFSVLV